MKESELMKLDWVMIDEECYEPYEISRVYIRVDHYNCGTIYGKKDGCSGTYIAHCEDDSQYCSRKYSRVMPIPLMPEILEKNGFEPNEYGDWIVNKNDYFIGWSMIRKTARIIVYSTIECVQQDAFVSCQYVHNFQHALRLCGLNDLADNFKIS